MRPWKFYRRKINCFLLRTSVKQFLQPREVNKEFVKQLPKAPTEWLTQRQFCPKQKEDGIQFIGRRNNNNPLHNNNKNINLRSLWSGSKDTKRNREILNHHHIGHYKYAQEAKKAGHQCEGIIPAAVWNEPTRILERAQATSGFNDIILYNPDAWDSWALTVQRYVNWRPNRSSGERNVNLYTLCAHNIQFKFNVMVIPVPGIRFDSDNNQVIAPSRADDG